MHIFFIEINILAIKSKFVLWYKNLLSLRGSQRLNMVFKLNRYFKYVPCLFLIPLHLPLFLFAALLLPTFHIVLTVNCGSIHVPAHMKFRIVKSICISVILEGKRVFNLRLRSVRISWFSPSYIVRIRATKKNVKYFIKIVNSKMSFKILMKHCLPFNKGKHIRYTECKCFFLQYHKSYSFEKIINLLVKFLFFNSSKLHWSLFCLRK